LYVDLDEFKHLNDDYGHHVGDELLCQAAERLRTTLRGGDTVARLGGDEFAIILPRVSTEDEVHAAARRVRESFAQPFELESVTVRISASVGEAMSPEHGTTIDTLVRHADAAMYRAKQARTAPVAR